MFVSKSQICQIRPFDVIWFENLMILVVSFYNTFILKTIWGNKSFLDLYWLLLWVFRARVDASLLYLVTYAQQIPQIYLFCDNCRPLGRQHGSWAILSMYFCWCTGIGGTRVQDQACHCLTVGDKTDALPTELRRVGSSFCNTLFST